MIPERILLEVAEIASTLISWNRHAYGEMVDEIDEDRVDIDTRDLEAILYQSGHCVSIDVRKNIYTSGNMDWTVNVETETSITFKTTIKHHETDADKLDDLVDVIYGGLAVHGDQSSDGGVVT